MPSASTGDCDICYSSATNYVRAVFVTNAVVVEFKPIPGWNLPTDQTLTVSPGLLITNIAFYTATNPVLVANPQGIGMTGTTGTVYQIESRSSLTAGNWLSVSTNAILSNGFNPVLPLPTTDQSAAFYRAVWLPDADGGSIRHSDDQ